MILGTSSDARSVWRALAVLNGATFRDKQLTGRFAGTIPSHEAKSFPDTIYLSLLLREGTLQGLAAAESIDDPPAALSSYVEMRPTGTRPGRERSRRVNG